MRPATAGLLAACRTSHADAVELVTLGATTLAPVLDLTPYLTAGSVSIDRDRVPQRTLNVTLNNPAGVLSPAVAADPLFPNRLLRVRYGVTVAGITEWVTLGVFLIDRPTLTLDSISVTAQDRNKLAARSNWTTAETFPGGTALSVVIRSIATAAGMGATLYRLTDGGASLAADRTFDVGQNRQTEMYALARAYALSLYVDADGYLVLAPAVTVTSLGTPVWTFEPGELATDTGVGRELGDDRLYNHVLVSGESAGQNPVAAEARDLNPASPAYNPVDGSGPIGDRLYTYTSAFIASVAQAQAVADALLLTVALVEEAVTLGTSVLPFLEGGDVVRVVDAAARIDRTYFLDTVTVPLATGEMGLTMKAIRALT